MTVLMFGWEFPPHISGGLGTACRGLSMALLEERVRLLFVVPKAHGDEGIPLINASDVVVDAKTLFRRNRKTHAGGSRVISVRSSLMPYSGYDQRHEMEQWNWSFTSQSMLPEGMKKGIRFSFTGKYGDALMEEVFRYAQVASVIARQQDIDIIHAHDWMTYPAGVEAKRVTGKPLIVHVHATEFDRAEHQNRNHRVLEIESEGMREADRIIAVSQWTKNIIVEKYGIDAEKIYVVHNGITEATLLDPLFKPAITGGIITFLGRITYQKGPRYFIAAAKKVLSRYPDTHFIISGSGDLLPALIEEVAVARLSSRIHFTGFLKGTQVDRIWSLTDVYVMPSVSEPFGITPLEAVQAGIPVIISNQSGVAEVLKHAVKIDYWDTDSMADAIMNVLHHKSLSETLKRKSKKEIEPLTWTRAARKIKRIYHASCP